MTILYLPLKTEYFDQIKAGTKTEEYRLVNDFWKKRIEGKTFEKVVLTKGYPKSTDTHRRIECKWKGYKTKTINSGLLGEKVKVYAIDVSEKI